MLTAGECEDFVTYLSQSQANRDDVALGASVQDFHTYNQDSQTMGYGCNFIVLSGSIYVFFETAWASPLATDGATAYRAVCADTDLSLIHI